MLKHFWKKMMIFLMHLPSLYFFWPNGVVSVHALQNRRYQFMCSKSMKRAEVVIICTKGKRGPAITTHFGNIDSTHIQSSLYSSQVWKSSQKPCPQLPSPTSYSGSQWMTNSSQSTLSMIQLLRLYCSSGNVTVPVRLDVRRSLGMPQE